VKVEVFCDDVPRTAENFLALCASGYYDGTKFHRRAAAARAHAEPRGAG
jgi:peptidyl-prolyl cis-trans isomerase-like 3